MPTPTENFDGVTAPAVPAGETYVGPFITSTSSAGVSPTSGPNMLAMASTGAATSYFGMLNAPDSGGGDVVVRCNFNASTDSPSQQFVLGLVARAGSTSVTGSSGSYYWAQWDIAAAQISLIRVASGSPSSITSTTFSPPLPDWLQFALTLSGSSLALTIQRLSDSFWFNPGSGFQSGAATALSGTDSAIAGSGYAGVTMANRSDVGLFADDLDLSALGSPPSSPVLRRQAIIVPGVPRRRGRVLLSSPPRTPPNPPTTCNPLRIASPRRLRPGRVYLPANAGPFVAPPSVDGTPLTGIVARPTPTGRAVHRPGAVSIGILSRAQTPPPSGPMAATAAWGRSGPPRRGSASVVGWLTPPPDPAIAPAVSGTSQPVSRREPTLKRGRALVPGRTLGATLDSSSFFGTIGTIKPIARRWIRAVPGVVRIPRSPSIAPPFVPGPTVPPLSHSAMRPIARRERPRPAVIPAWLGGARRVMLRHGVRYLVYANSGSGPIDYDDPIAIVMDTSWTSGPLPAPSSWSFGVRAENQYGEEKNLDCALTVVFDADGRDITYRPIPPIGLRAIPTLGATLNVEWSYPSSIPRRQPTGFSIYATPGLTPSYDAPIATVSGVSVLAGAFAVPIGPLTAGVLYSIGVRAFNAFGDDGGTATVTAIPVSGGPGGVVGLTVTIRP